MFFSIDEKVFNTLDDICIGVVVANGVDCTKDYPEVREMLARTVEAKLLELKDANVKSLPALAPYHEAFKRLGINPNKYLCSIESLFTRLVKKGEIPSISPLVDLGNMISLKYGLPAGAHDMDTLDGDLTVRFANPVDCEKYREAAPEDNDEMQEGELLYASDTSTRTRRWIWRQTAAGRTELSASNLIFPVDGFSGTRAEVEAACNELAGCLSDIFGVEARVGILDKNHTKFKIANFTAEELEIEDNIKIMLKGVAKHTEVSEIRSKMQSARAENRPLRAKLGLDPSAPDIHLGHSVVLRKLKQLQDMGHEAIIIIGDFTGKIGDPSGKSKTRNALTDEQVRINAKTYEEQIFKVLDPAKTTVYFNSEWLSPLTFEDVVRLAAKCTVARIMERDDFANRFQNKLPIGLHEMFYPLMQAYDSVAIKADIELGGTDQIFNILMGRNIQRDFGQEPQLTLFMPLLEGLDGVEKMSKSLGNYIGVSESPKVIFEKVMKIQDHFIIKYYNLCTDVHPDMVAQIQRRLDSGANPRDVKMELAFEITTLYGGEAASIQAREDFIKAFQEGISPDDAEVITLSSSSAALGEELIAEILNIGNYKTKSEIRRLFAGNAVSIDGEKITDPSAITSIADGATLKLGKGKFYKIKMK